MKALLVTDHRFIRHQGRIYDLYCFGSAFFDDYLRVFEQLDVLCRISDVSELPANALPSERPGVCFHGVPDVRGLRWIAQAKRLSARPVRELSQRTDVVVTRVPSELGWYATRAARSLGKPYMIELIGDPAEAVRSIGRGLRYQLMGWFQSRRLKRIAREANVASYVNETCLPVIYPPRKGTPCDFISSIRLPEDSLTGPRPFTHATSPLRIVLVASLVPYKRHRDLIAACRQTVDAGVEVRVRFAGDGPLRSSLEDLCRAQGLEDHVGFAGHLASKSALTNLLDDSDLFVMPSTAAEGLPRAMLEAMARGLPAIGSRAAGIPELVRADDLFEIGDVRRLMQLLTSIAGDPSRLREMSRHSIAVANRYTNSKLSPRRERLYRQLAEMAATDCNPELAHNKPNYLPPAGADA